MRFEKPAKERSGIVFGGADESLNPKPSRAKGLYLIELLVVVTMIALLLALLMPAMDQAIYQAELAVCAANMRSTAQGMVNYALDHKRRHPHRPGIMAINGNWQPISLKQWTVNQFDDRPTFRDYISINQHLNDPLTKPVDIERDDANLDVYGSVAIWAGWKYRIGKRGMMRMGDRFDWNESSFDLLVSDRSFIAPGHAQNSHPDKDNVMPNLVSDNSADGPFFNAGGTYKTTLSIWWSQGNERRGPVDLNFAYQDLSVRRLELAWNDSYQADGRTVFAPQYVGGNTTISEVQLPRE